MSPTPLTVQAQQIHAHVHAPAWQRQLDSLRRPDRRLMHWHLSSESLLEALHTCPASLGILELGARDIESTLQQVSEQPWLTGQLILATTRVPEAWLQPLRSWGFLRVYSGVAQVRDFPRLVERYFLTRPAIEISLEAGIDAQLPWPRFATEGRAAAN